MANPHPIELLVERLVGLVPRAEFDAARTAFEARGGVFSAADSWNEERLRALADDIVVPRAPGFLSLAMNDDERAWILGMMACERSLFVVENSERLRCLLGGALYRATFANAPSERLRPGDIFDGRIASVGDTIRLLPGMIFHAEEAHESLLKLVQQARTENTPRQLVLDGLMRMRMRHDRFVSIHARHIYRFESLHVVEIKAASWKGPQGKRT